MHNVYIHICTCTHCVCICICIYTVYVHRCAIYVIYLYVCAEMYQRVSLTLMWPFYLTNIFFKTIVLFSFVAKFEQFWKALGEKCRGLDLITQTVIHAPSSRGGGERVRSVCMFVSLPAFSFSGSIDRRMSCLMWRWHASEAADAMCHPFVTSTPSNPSQKALPLCVCCYACGLPQHRGCVQCVHVSVGAWSLCVVALTNLLKLPAPMSPLAAAEVQGEGARPLWKTPVLPSIQPPSMPLFHSPADIFLETRWMN